MKTAVAIAIICMASALAFPLGAEPRCSCVANGRDYELGETACLSVGGRTFLAQCARVLNNTSWKKIADECPQASIRPSPAIKAKAGGTGSVLGG
jgi:hypothetical protein